MKETIIQHLFAAVIALILAVPVYLSPPFIGWFLVLLFATRDDIAATTKINDLTKRVAELESQVNSLMAAQHGGGQ